MLDADIRHALVRRLADEHPSGGRVRIWPEMTVGLGASRVDVGLINGAISGFEIKSDRDNLARLPRQVLHYGRCLDYAHVIVSGRHTQRVFAHVPSWWGIHVAEQTDSMRVTLTQERAAGRNPYIEPFFVAQLLWRNEGHSLLKENDAHQGLAKATRWEIWDALAARLSFGLLQSGVRRILTERGSHEDS